MFCFLNNSKSQCIDSTLINPSLYLSNDLCLGLCFCNGIGYSNDCLAQCDGNTFGVLLIQLSHQVCLASFCFRDVSIIGDSVPCNYPKVIEAVSAGTAPITSIVWTDAQGNILSNGNLLTVANTGVYHVTITDSSGCMDSATINKCKQ